jgi:hypothetical protein
MRRENDIQPLRTEGSGMLPPGDLTLPFFAYGVFKPGELAFLQIKDLVHRHSAMNFPGKLRVRDGLPIASLDSGGEIEGELIFFHPGSQELAYRRIADLEPDKQYRWETRTAGAQNFNLLVGISPDQGSQDMTERWDGRNDPLFTAALEVVEEVLHQNQVWSWDMKPLFRLEMAYLLLWTSIERYASLRYHLGDKVYPKVSKIASEPAFRDALGTIVSDVTELRTVQRADNPIKRCTLDPRNPKKAMDYYYQVRSNLVHRGKGVGKDHQRIMKSLEELIAIFRATLDGAFAESNRPIGE